MNYHLKAKRTFALDIMLQTNLLDYLKSCFFPQPGDWPSQLYTRQTVYETWQKFYHENCTKTFTSTTDHSYHIASYTAHSSYVPVNRNSSPPSILSLIPCIGPLHVSLNGREMLFNDFSPFSANMYEQLFPKCKLGKHPKLWRITMILASVYGGWFHKRDSVKDKFKQRRLLPSSQSAVRLFRRDCFRSVRWNINLLKVSEKFMHVCMVFWIIHFGTQRRSRLRIETEIHSIIL